MEKKRILVVDDETLIVKTVKFRLEREGFDVFSTDDAAEAFEKLDAENFDLVVTDLLMPVHSGMEIAQKTKMVSQGKTPVIILSAAGQEKHVVDAFKIGVDEYVTKPFSPEELLFRIKKLL